MRSLCCCRLTAKPACTWASPLHHRIIASALRTLVVAHRRILYRSNFCARDANRTLLCNHAVCCCSPGVQPGLLLADLTEPEASGKAKPRRVGPTMSKRLHLLLTSEDPDAIVEAAGEATD